VAQAMPLIMSIKGVRDVDEDIGRGVESLRAVRRWISGFPPR